jgi:hypothetical protein
MLILDVQDVELMSIHNFNSKIMDQMSFVIYVKWLTKYLTITIPN